MLKLILLDTNAIIHLGEKNTGRLGQNLYIDLTTQPFLVHPISYFEIGIKHKKKHLKLKQPLNQWVNQLRKIPTLREIKLNWEDFFIAASFSYPKRDPADRMIVAAAQIRNLTIVTSDQAMIDFQDVDTIGY